MGSMSESEIKPVAWVPPTFFDKGVLAATARRAPPSETAVEMRGEYSPLYDQSAIDRLSEQLNHYRMAAEAEALLADRRKQEIDRLTAQRDGYLKQHGRDSAELRRLCAQRDSLRAEAMRYREVIEYALAQYNGRHFDRHNHWAAKAMNELADLDAARAKELLE